MEPNDPIYWKQRAMDFYNDDRIEEARECWINALDLDPDDIVVWKLLRNASRDAGDVNGAEFCSEKIRELEQKNAAEPDSAPIAPVRKDDDPILQRVSESFSPLPVERKSRRHSLEWIAMFITGVTQIENHQKYKGIFLIAGVIGFVALSLLTQDISASIMTGFLYAFGVIDSYTILAGKNGTRESGSVQSADGESLC